MQYIEHSWRSVIRNKAEHSYKAMVRLTKRYPALRGYDWFTVSPLDTVSTLFNYMKI